MLRTTLLPHDCPWHVLHSMSPLPHGLPIGMSLPTSAGAVPCHDVRGEVGQVLDDLGDEGEGTGGLLVRVLLHEAEEAGGHHGRAEEPQEERGADQPVGDVLAAPLGASQPPRGKDLLQLPWEHAVWWGDKVRDLQWGRRGMSPALRTHQCELTTLQRASSQHMRRLAWWSAKVEAEHFMGSTSQFSSDSYSARMNSPARGQGRQRGPPHRPRVRPVRWGHGHEKGPPNHLMIMSMGTWK